MQSLTYAYEFCTLRKVIELLRGPRYTLRSYSIEVDTPPCSILRLQNRVLNTQHTKLTNSFLKKRNVEIAYYQCREAVATSFARIQHIKMIYNPSDNSNEVIRNRPEDWPIK